MDHVDEEKTLFITDRGTYSYKVMPSGLKTTGATYQRLVTKMFQEHLEKTMEVYIDDMLVKTQHSGDHISHLSDTLQILQKFNMKLNPEKCAFGVASEIPDMLTSRKEVQRLTERIAALGRFISKSSEKCFKFFSALKKKDQFEWTEEYTQKFEGIPVKSAITRKTKGWGKIAYLPCCLRSSDFVANFSQGMQLEAEKELQVFTGSNPGIWTLFADGSSNVKGAGLGIVLVPPMGETIRQAIKCHSITNNETKYEAVIAGAFKQVREKEVRDFIWRNIICRFGVKKEIVCDNGPQFIGAQITEFFQSWHIKRITSTPYHPVGNGQAELTNKVIINNLKKRLEEPKGNWPELLPGVLWAYHTTTKTSTGETPFSLVYGVEALIPVEIGEPSSLHKRQKNLMAKKCT
ncbi:uncharacterized protein [Nicotiana sylvestris]|uniref:uncharacterized protein n=1 Tax=Nicotiana sylvestris TaxID=4096 RepID=UPI00388CA4F2